MSLHNIAFAELVLCWAVWCYIPIFRAPHRQKRASVTLKGATLLGLLFETGAYAIASVFRAPQPVAAVRDVVCILAAPIGVAVMWTAVAHLGRQFRINAGLYNDHQLVRTGPYSMVRHPIYASMMLMLVATAMDVTRGPWIAVALVCFIVGTEIRVRTEDGLLASRFGDQFVEYRSQVAAYIPFLR